MVIDNKFNIGQIVFLQTDPDQDKRIVTAISVRSGGYVAYELSFGPETSWHIECEISTQKVVI
jgi:hypothetical protein